MSKYLVLYTSKTGNTKKLATEIFSLIPDSSKDCFPFDEFDNSLEADTYFIGFWADRGTCSMEVIDFLSELHGKKIALFGTCGMSTDQDYYRCLEEKVKVWIADDNQYLGAFLCQGKMPIQIRQKYETMRNSGNQTQIDSMIQNFDQALLHPNKEDFAHAKEFVLSLMPATV